MLFEDIDELYSSLKPGFKRTVEGLCGSSMALALATLARHHAGLCLVLVPDTNTALRLEAELPFFLDTQAIPCLSFPAWETLPYDHFSPHQDIISQRLKTLYQLAHTEKGILLVPISSCMSRLCPKTYLLQQALILRKGQSIDRRVMERQLIEVGYQRVAQVQSTGTFAARGSILDLFPSSSATPIRIDFFGDELESLRHFNPETQRSEQPVDQITLLPAKEYPLDESGLSLFRKQFRAIFDINPQSAPLYAALSEGGLSSSTAPSGLEYYLPLFFEKTQSLFEYVPENVLITSIDDITQASEQYWQHIHERFAQYGHDRLRPLLPPTQAFFQSHEVLQAIKGFKHIHLKSDQTQNNLISVRPLPSLWIEAKAERPLAKLESFLESFKGHLLFSAESQGRAVILKERLQGIGCQTRTPEDWDQFFQKRNSPAALMVSPLEAGFICDNIAIICESDLLPNKVMQRRLRQDGRASDANNRTVFQDYSELKPGTLVVHLEHGIGRYEGLVPLSIVGQENEFLALIYAGGDKLYVPVSAVQLISPYVALDPEHVPLSKLGSDQWQRAKKKAMEQVRDTAAELLDIYARRAKQKGFSCGTPDGAYDTFAAGFPFEETPDQSRAIEAVISDLCSDKPMDRVICGDVGFGKTEVALRAAFLVVQNAKQVLVLVPTTLLAEQHFQTFSDRFSQFPVNIEVISRFKSKAEQAAILEKIRDSKIDILIGTHKVLYGTLPFSRLGLFILDEEHRFGVQQKEAFKSLRSELHMLTLTATPIPRTLNMAMNGLRDLSIIATPPQKRLSIKTFVRERNKDFIQEALLRELHRGGQVYFVHNAVQSIEKEAAWLRDLVPQAKIAVAHGQMRTQNLERIMSDFYHKKFDILVCTTIIETGIDIPSANTLIIDRADQLGLAQLHQLRGRVGRSHHQAYAFCLVPPQKQMSPDAQKRLEALESMDALGSGFQLASQDLEIRGAGELLGDSQSGHIQSIGFELYNRLLEKAVQILKKDPNAKDYDLEFSADLVLELRISAFIPEHYQPDVTGRMRLYQRIAKAATVADLDLLQAEMIDRFGALPEVTQRLFEQSALKLQAGILGLTKIEATPQGGRLIFALAPRLNTEALIHLIQSDPQHYRLEGPQCLSFKADLSDPKYRLEYLKSLLHRLSAIS